MVFENYRGAKMTLGEAADAADLLSLSDVTEKRIRQESEWTLLPVQGVFVIAAIMGKRLCPGLNSPLSSETSQRQKRI